MEYKIAVLPGDGIGPEVTEQACDVLSAIGEKFAHTFKFAMADIGGIAYDKTGHPLPKETIAISKASDAILLGAVGGEKWDTLPGNMRPEAALLGIRSELELFANLRPALLYKELASACPLRPEITGGDLDLMIVRELTGGLYFGKRGRTGEGESEAAYDTLAYSKAEILRIGKIAFELAQGRNKKLTSVDKANILESSRLWRTTMEELSGDYPDVELNHLYVDNAAMQLVRNPKQFDVIVTGNLFGDILSDEAAMITGSIGMLPSASLSSDGPGLYEPVHGSAPDIAGQSKANPLAAILSVAMLLKWSLHLDKEAKVVEDAVKAALGTGKRTGDLLEGKGEALSTKEMGKLVLDFIQNS